METILVTGALGNVGGEVVKQLQAEALSVRVADLDAGTIRGRFGDGVEAIRFDFSDPETYPVVLAGVKRMFLMRPPHISN